MKKAREAEVVKMQDEKEKLERVRLKMRQKVLQRVNDKKEAAAVLAAQQPTVETNVMEVISETEEERLAKEEAERKKKKKERKMYKSRHQSFLKNMAESRKEKEEQDAKKQKKKLRNKKKLATNLGYGTVTSKLYEPTVSSIVNSNLGIDNIADIKGAKVAQTLVPSEDMPLPKPKAPAPPPPPPSSEEEMQRKKEAAAAMKKRAAENLARITEARAAEERKQAEYKAKEEMKLKKAREAVLSMRNTTEPIRSRKKVETVTEATPVKKVVNKAEHEKMIQRLAKAPKRTGGPIITDIELWRKKHKLEPKDKIFIIAGGYSILRQAMTDRGWTENKERESPCFDLKWTCKSKDIDYNNLTENQQVNHFVKAHEITSKVGVARNMKRLSWFTEEDPDVFFPRNFDLLDDEEYAEFIIDFKLTKAECVLKDYVFKNKYGDGEELDPERVQTALDVSNRRLTDLDDLIDMKGSEVWNPITDAEWLIIAGDEHKTEQDLKRARYDKWLNKNLPKSKKKKAKRRRKQDVESASESEEEDDEQEEEQHNPLVRAVKECLDRLKDKFPQFDINGQTNAWIMKPAGKSRGRGIVCMNQLTEIIGHIQKEGWYVIQKYIERPLLVLKKKFDIRQWVLVTDLNPLTIWFYDRSYCRFSMDDFTLKELENKFIHLTNNSIVKNADNFYASEIDGCMWHSEEMEVYLQEKFGYDIWTESVMPRMKQIVINSLECVQDAISARKNSFEMFGYDIMLDSSGNPWLIEVNSSPAMDYSTPVTTELVKEVLADVPKVVVDYNYASRKKKPNVDTGAWKLIHRSKRTIERPTNSFGLNLMCEGVQIKKNK